MEDFYWPGVKVLNVDSGDLLTLFAGIAIVVLVAVMANPGYVSELQNSSANLLNPNKTVITTFLPLMTGQEYPEQIPVITPVQNKSGVVPYRILYTDDPFSYPAYRLPENMGTTGASETPRESLDLVPFAVIENTRGGLTRVFSVPYPVWFINTTVVAKNQPQYANFRMALCYADTGGIIRAEEIVQPGTSYRIIRTANTSMYMIISVQNIDSYQIRLETPKEYYDAIGTEISVK
jgi:hypothetical protein